MCLENVCYWKDLLLDSALLFWQLIWKKWKMTQWPSVKLQLWKKRLPQNKKYNIKIKCFKTFQFVSSISSPIHLDVANNSVHWNKKKKKIKQNQNLEKFHICLWIHLMFPVLSCGCTNVSWIELLCRTQLVERFLYQVESWISKELKIPLMTVYECGMTS